MPHAITIRAARGPDREWCARLMASNEPWITLRRGLEARRAQLQRPGTELFVAREGRLLLGLILLSTHGLAGSPYINSIAVVNGRRGCGIGSQLMAFAEWHFAGSRHLFLCVSSFNRSAQRLYRRLGYKRVAVFEDYVVNEHSEWLFHKRLA